jgi:hypothetical protein
MPTAPKLTAEQRSAALAEAALARTARAAARAELKAGRLSVGQLLAGAEGDPRLAAMRVSALLESLPGYGPARTAALLAELHIADTRRIRGLGPKQRAALLTAIGHAAQSQS